MNQQLCLTHNRKSIIRNQVILGIIIHPLILFINRKPKIIKSNKIIKCNHFFIDILSNIFIKLDHI